MKVYVDKNDEDLIEDSFFANNTKLISEFWHGESELQYDECQLLDLADHDKQVRKQVCDEIVKSIEDIENKIFDRYPEGAVLSEYYSQQLRCYDEILNILEKVKKGR